MNLAWFYFFNVESTISVLGCLCKFGRVHSFALLVHHFEMVTASAVNAHSITRVRRRLAVVDNRVNLVFSESLHVSHGKRVGCSTGEHPVLVWLSYFIEVVVRHGRIHDHFILLDRPWNRIAFKPIYKISVFDWVGFDHGAFKVWRCNPWIGYCLQVRCFCNGLVCYLDFEFIYARLDQGLRRDHRWKLPSWCLLFNGIMDWNWRDKRLWLGIKYVFCNALVVERPSVVILTQFLKIHIFLEQESLHFFYLELLGQFFFECRRLLHLL